VPTVRAVATRRGDYGYDPQHGRWIAVTPIGLVAQSLQIAGPVPPVMYGAVAGEILELPLHFPATFQPTKHATTPTHSVSLHGITGVGKLAPSFAPAPRTIRLRDGQHRQVHYLLRVPPQPGPLDVDFLVDTTDSMQPAIAGLRHGMQQIITALGAGQADLEVGLADFRDFNDGTGIALPSDPTASVGAGLLHKRHLYVRDQAIAPVGPSLGRALGSLSAAGGGDPAEADTIAVMQALTGSGVPAYVPAGQNAGFRPNATKVIVLITNSGMHLSAPYPTMAKTVTTLRAYGVKVVGLVVDVGGIGTADADMRQLVGQSGTVAPPGGVDCDGDGTVDVRAGAPLVCNVATSAAGVAALAGPVSRLVEQVADPAELAVRLQSTHAQAASLVGAAHVHANLHATNRLPATVDYSCPNNAGRQHSTVRLAGLVSGVAVAHIVAEVRCLPVPHPKPAVIPAAVVPAAVNPPEPAPVAPAPPPPPPPVSGNANPNVNPGTGAAAEQEKQSQLAVADAEAAPQPGPAPDPAGPAAPVLYASALALAGATALALRTRSRTALNTATATARRRPGHR
jgi:hypothetical protein